MSNWENCFVRMLDAIKRGNAKLLPKMQLSQSEMVAKAKAVATLLYGKN